MADSRIKTATQAMEVDGKGGQGGKSPKNPHKPPEKASSTVMANRLLASFGGRVQSPPSSMDDILGEGKESLESMSDFNDSDSNKNDKSENGETDSVASESTSHAGGSLKGGQNQAAGKGKSRFWKGKSLDSMTEEERKAANEERKAVLEGKRQDRDETQAEWVRLVKPVVNDHDPALFKRVLRAMNLTEDKLKSQGNYIAKLIEEGRKTLALILWTQQRDSTNTLVRYIMGQIVHEPATADQAAIFYDPEVAVEDKSMQVKLLQLFIELSQRLTKREAAQQHAAEAARQKEQLSKTKRRWNKGKKDEAAHPGGKKPKPGQQPNKASSSGVGPSGLFKDGKQGSEDQSTSKKRYPSEEQNSAEKPPRKMNKDDLTVALQNVSLGGKNVVQAVKLPKSDVNSIENRIKEVLEPVKEIQKPESKQNAKPACEKLIHPACLNCSDDDVQVTYAKAVSDNNPFQNLMSIKVVRQTLDGEGNLTIDYPGMSKAHWDQRFCPAMEECRVASNLERLQNGEKPYRAIRAQRYATGKPNRDGQDQPNFGLLLPVDEDNSKWLIRAVGNIELSAGSENKTYRYVATKAFESGTGTCVLSFKVNKIGSDLSIDKWEQFCYDNNIDSSWTRRMEPKIYTNESEVVFAATKRLVEQLKLGDDKVGREPGMVLFGFQGERQLLHKTKSLKDTPINSIQFQLGPTRRSHNKFQFIMHLLY